MTTYIKKITEKTIWIILKVYSGGRIEFTDAYWNEDSARSAASKQLPMTGDTFTISLHTANLHGSMIDKANEY